MQLKRTNRIACSTIIFGVLLIFHQSLKAQDKVLKIGLSPGIASGPSNEGFGLQYELGYQQSIWNDRFRINPSFSIGHYRLPLFSPILVISISTPGR